MLAGNEDAYVAYLEKKVADQEAAAAATATAAAAKEASAKAARRFSQAHGATPFEGINRVPDDWCGCVIGW